MSLDLKTCDEYMSIDEDTYNSTSLISKSFKLNRFKHDFEENHYPSKRIKLNEEEREDLSNSYIEDEDDIDAENNSEIIQNQCPKISIGQFGHYCLNESNYIAQVNCCSNNVLFTSSNETKENYHQIAYKSLRDALVENTFGVSPFRSSSSSSCSSSHGSSLSTSPSKLTDQFLIKSLEIFDLKDNDMYDNFENLLTNKPINKMFKFNFDQLSLHRIETFIFLIERNMSNKILSPFDQYAYMKLKSNRNQSIQYLNNELINKQQRNDYNYYNIKKISKLLRTFNFSDRNFLKQNNLMPNCVSSLLMPFFFDIFNMSELKLFGDETVNIMLSLKQSYKAQIYMDEFTLTSYLTENIVWNCLALFKLKLPNMTDKETTRMGFFNFYLSYLYIQMHLQSISNDNEMNSQEKKRSTELGFILPHLLDALILTGYFNQNDFISFKNFCGIKKRRIQAIEQQYLENSMKNVSSSADICFPLKLKNLCRIQIKKSLINYNVDSLNQLNIPKSTQRFIMYNDELDLIYSKKSRIF